MKIYVGGLSPEVTDDELKELFSPHGQVESATVVRDRYTAQPRGFGFVEMPTKAEAIAAIAALSGTELKGQVLNVSEARPPEERRGGGGPRGQGRPRGDRPDRGRRY
ncbi:MAG: RNA-binding protein [Candidatus Zixiibacteriota bacterium]